jgi:hypothetical protein
MGVRSPLGDATVHTLPDWWMPVDLSLGLLPDGRFVNVDSQAGVIGDRYEPVFELENKWVYQIV